MFVCDRRQKTVIDRRVKEFGLRQWKPSAKKWKCHLSARVSVCSRVPAFIPHYAAANSAKTSAVWCKMWWGWDTASMDQLSINIVYNYFELSQHILPICCKQWACLFYFYLIPCTFFIMRTVADTALWTNISIPSCYLLLFGYLRLNCFRSSN